MVTKVIKVIAANGIPFQIRHVAKGEKFGLNFALTHEYDIPAIEFYDARFNHTLYGQFVTRYQLDTLQKNNHYDGRYGLDLHGGIEDWKIDAATMKQIMNNFKV